MKQKYLKNSTQLYTNTQILWGFISVFTLIGTIVFPRANVLEAYLLSDKKSISIATFSGQIHEIGRLKNQNIYVITGMSKDSFSDIYVLDNLRLIQTSLPNITKNLLKPVLTQDGKYIFFAVNAGSGKRIIMRHEIATSQQQEIVESSLPLTTLKVSSDNSLLGLGVEMNMENQVKRYVLGIVQVGAKNLNLFPSVEMKNNGNILFSEDNKTLFVDTISGAGLFEIRSSKIVQTVMGGELVSWDANNQLIIGQGKKRMTQCRKGLYQTSGYNRLEVYQVQGLAFSQLTNNNAINKFNTIGLPFTDPVLINNTNNNWITLVTNYECNEEIALYNQKEEFNTIYSSEFTSGPYIYVP